MGGRRSEAGDRAMIFSGVDLSIVSVLSGSLPVMAGVALVVMWWLDDELSAQGADQTERARLDQTAATSTSTSTSAERSPAEVKRTTPARSASAVSTAT